MGGTKQGGSNIKQSMLKRFNGDMDKLREHFSSIGQKGGLAPHKTPRGFSASRELASAAGRLGGLASRRGKNKVK